MFGLFFPKVYLVKSKIWPFLKQNLAFFIYNLLATLTQESIPFGTLDIEKRSFGRLPELTRLTRLGRISAHKEASQSMKVSCVLCPGWTFYKDIHTVASFLKILFCLRHRVYFYRSASCLWRLWASTEAPLRLPRPSWPASRRPWPKTRLSTRRGSESTRKRGRRS